MLPVISKVLERIMETQLRSFIEKSFSQYMCGYRKGYNTRYALMAFLEKWKKSIDNHGYAGSIIMDLSKAFDTINHELLVAKLHAYCLNKPALKLVTSRTDGIELKLITLLARGKNCLWVCHKDQY